MKLEFVWFFFTFFIVLFSFLSITSGNPVFGVLFLVLAFLSSALFLISLGIDFIGLMLMVVYVGAISVLFLFVVMMLNVNEEFSDFPFFTFLLIFTLLFFTYLNVTFCPLGDFFSYTNWFHLDKLDTLSCLGYVLYSDHILNFLEISIVLMIAMVGAIALNFTSEKGMRDQEFLFQSSRSTEIALFIK
jgi:NADH-quinone oxidoreductase subunit J